jgi:DNA-directed RNA polymerase subunit H (RpoH/RPB5)
MLIIIKLIHCLLTFRSKGELFIMKPEFRALTPTDAETVVRNAATMFGDRGYRDIRTVYQSASLFPSIAVATAPGGRVTAADYDYDNVLDAADSSDGDEEYEDEDANEEDADEAVEVEEEEDEELDEDDLEVDSSIHNLSEVVENVGNDVSEDLDDEWAGNLADCSSLFVETLDAHMALTARRPDGARVALFLIANDSVKLGVQTVQALRNIAVQRRLAHVVLVSDSRWSHQARMELIHQAPFEVEHFECVSLAIVVARHEMVPHHRALSSAEAKVVNLRYRCGWGKINPDTDPVAQYYHWPLGTLIELTFASRTNGLATEYRVVAHPVS